MIMRESERERENLRYSIQLNPACNIQTLLESKFQTAKETTNQNHLLLCLFFQEKRTVSFEWIVGIWGRSRRKKKKKMAVVEEKSATDAKVWSLCRMPFWHSGNGSTSSSAQLTQNHQQQVLGSNQQQVNSVSTVARSLLSFGRRLRLDPASKLYFPCELLFNVSFQILEMHVLMLLGVFGGFGDMGFSF